MSYNVPLMFYFDSNKKELPTKQKNATRQKEEAMTQPPTKTQSQSTSLSLDWEAYGALLENSDMSEEQKRELIHVLWSIVVSFVDLGFGVHPLQQVHDEDISFDELVADDVVRLSQDTPTAKIDHATAPLRRGQRERSL